MEVVEEKEGPRVNAKGRVRRERKVRQRKKLV